MEVRKIPRDEESKWLLSYGTFDAGGELMRAAWSKLSHVFSVQRSEDVVSPLQEDPSSIIINGCPNFPSKLLNQHPVDLLVVERCSQLKSLAVGKRFSWESAVNKTHPTNRPQVVLESWLPISATWTRGPTDKCAVIRWCNLGFDTEIKILRGLDVGGATRHNRIMVI